jgi:hypothetical protein
MGYRQRFAIRGISIPDAAWRAFGALLAPGRQSFHALHITNHGEKAGYFVGVRGLTAFDGMKFYSPCAGERMHFAWLWLSLFA